MNTRPATVEEIAVALGAGKQVRTSGGWKTICPLHDDNDPSLIIYEKGEKDNKPWASCPVCGTNKELYAAIEQRTGLHFAERRSEAKKKTIYPAPKSWEPVRFRGASPSKHWEYNDEKGRLLFVVARYDFPAGKVIRPYSVVEQNGQAVWRSILTLKPRPPYKLDVLAANPDAPVLIVEGEKAADAAQLLPEFEDYVVTTFQGGAKSWRQADKSAFKGRKIFLSPDNDHVGRKAFFEMGMFFNTSNFAESCKLIVPPESFPEKWDLADDFPDGRSMADMDIVSAPKPDRRFQLSNVDMSNYEEVFDSLYWLYHDGQKLHTISKEFREFSKGAAVRPGASYSTMQINPHHEAYLRLKIDGVPAINLWASERMAAGDFVKGYGFFPDNDEQVVEEDGAKKYNGFTGFAFEPVMEASCDMFKELILEVLCDNDKDAYSYVMNYLAHMIQFPAEKPNVALIFIGLKGTGKSFFFNILHQLLGGLNGYGASINSSESFNSAFNGVYSSCNLALFVHEWQVTKSRTIENKLKSLITDPMLTVNLKYVNEFTTPNYLRLFGASNHSKVWNATMDERRLTVFEVNDFRQQHDKYFEAIYEQMHDGGFGRLMYDLQSWQVNKSLIRRPYQNKALAVQKSFTKTPAQELAFEMLRSGEIELTLMDTATREAKERYFVSYEDWSKGWKAIPAALVRDVIEQKYMKGPHNGMDDLSGKNQANAIGVLEWMGVNIKDKQRSSAHTILRGSRVAKAAWKIPRLSAARHGYASKLGLTVEEVFGDNEDVIPFPTKTTKPGEAPF